MTNNKIRKGWTGRGLVALSFAEAEIGRDNRNRLLESVTIVLVRPEKLHSKRTFRVCIDKTVRFCRIRLCHFRRPQATLALFFAPEAHSCFVATFISRDPGSCGAYLPAAASSMTLATSFGWDSIATWLERNSVVVAFICLAMLLSC